MGMDRQSILLTPYGEFMDMIDCDAISRGKAKQKIKKKMTFDEFISLR